MSQSLFKKHVLSFLALFVFSIIINSCESDTQVTGGGNEDQTEKTVKLSGQVISKLTSAPIDSAQIVVSGLNGLIVFYTDSQGKFNRDITVTSSVNLTLVIAKAGYVTDSVSVFVSGNSDVTVPIIELEYKSTSSVPSGDPVSIFLLSQSTNSIGVKESGAEETAKITFVVQDSAGVPVDLAHSVDVSFKFGAGPGGGEVLSPSIVKTNNSGQAAVNLTSGTKAGVVQIIAEITIGSKKIVSLPVAISIHGGLPDFAHFSIAPQKLNFAGYNIFGLQDPITAYVGDKYANPVRPFTSVYFTTTGGIIEGSIQTNIQGIGTSNLISALPQPNHPIFGPGFATVTATTADQNSNNISRETLVLFSGVPQMSVSPLSFSIPEGGSQTFSYVLSDQNSNPLAGGTSIKVSVDGEDVKAQGDVDIILPDTQSKGWTQFNFIVWDAEVDTLPNVYTPVIVSIKSEGPNGKAQVTISGQKD
ncbi:MAG: hypothetical protein HXY50_02200 [Ignavibacteriaceae bacterium]|nr:hypothetical protein [Ignavibacteriaceae bacterium]